MTEYIKNIAISDGLILTMKKQELRLFKVPRGCLVYKVTCFCSKRLAKAINLGFRAAENDSERVQLISKKEESAQKCAKIDYRYKHSKNKPPTGDERMGILELRQKVGGVEFDYKDCVSCFLNCHRPDEVWFGMKDLDMLVKHYVPKDSKPYAGTGDVKFGDLSDPQNTR